MDFRAGPPTQAVQTITASGQPNSGQLAAAGLNATWVLNGPTRMNATFIERRNGSSDLAVAADLTGAELKIAPLEWHKPRGTAAKASARLVLDHDRLTRIDNMQLDGEGLAVRAQGTFNDGVLTQLQVSRLVLGATVAQGSVRFPQTQAGGPHCGELHRLDARPRARTSRDRRRRGSPSQRSRNRRRGRAGRSMRSSTGC